MEIIIPQPSVALKGLRCLWEMWERVVESGVASSLAVYIKQNICVKLLHLCLEGREVPRVQSVRPTVT